MDFQNLSSRLCPKGTASYAPKQTKTVVLVEQQNRVSAHSCCGAARPRSLTLENGRSRDWEDNGRHVEIWTYTMRYYNIHITWIIIYLIQIRYLSLETTPAKRCFMNDLQLLNQCCSNSSRKCLPVFGQPNASGPAHVLSEKKIWKDDKSARFPTSCHKLCTVRRKISTTEVIVPRPSPVSGWQCPLTSIENHGLLKSWSRSSHYFKKTMTNTQTCAPFCMMFSGVNSSQNNCFSYNML